MSSLMFPTGKAVREACRQQEWTGPTCGLAAGYTQANLVILPEDLAWEFLLFCQKNPKPCPLLHVTEPGDPFLQAVAADADIRTDLPGYRVFRNGELVEERADIAELWQQDLVSFLIGCSFTFESAMLRAGVPVRHLERGTNVSMYRTNLPCVSTPRFSGPMVVSMHPLKPADAIKAIQITSRYPAVHGAPVHIGFPEEIGIPDLARPDFGEPTPIEPGELPVFWGCGVTPQAVVMESRPTLAITHSPGCMFVTDLLDEALTLG